MKLTPAALALSLALTSTFAAADPTASTATTSQGATKDIRALAETLVSVGDEREHEAKALEPVEHLLSAQITMRLSLTDPDVSAKVKQVVYDALSPVVPKAIDAVVDAYAVNFSADELGRVIAFVESPAGQAEMTNLPLLKIELTAALSGSPETAKAGDIAAQVFEAASPARRAFVQRILKAQDFEVHTRQGYAALVAISDAAALRMGVASSADQPGAEARAKAADDYVRLVTEIEEGFYVTHYTDAQLAASANYLESEPGQAILTRLPVVKRAMGAVLQRQLSGAVTLLTEKVCAAVTCTPEQQTRLAEFTAIMATGVSSRSVFTGSPN